MPLEPIQRCACRYERLGPPVGGLSLQTNTPLQYWPPPTIVAQSTQSLSALIRGGGSKDQTTFHTCGAPKSRHKLHVTLSHGKPPASITTWKYLNSPWGGCTWSYLHHIGDLWSTSATGATEPTQPGVKTYSPPPSQRYKGTSSDNKLSFCDITP